MVNATLARLTRLTIDATTIGDGPLLEAFLAGDQSAFTILVRRHATLVFATCKRILRHHQDAEDAFQATFLVLARRARDVWPRESVASWLFGVARRVALKARVARARQCTREQSLPDLTCEQTPGTEFDLVEAVQRVICKLPEVYRAAVVACDLEGLSRKEAAERLGWSEGTLSGRLSRARGLLAKRLRRIGLSLPPSGVVGLVASETASAAVIQSTIELATGGTAGMPATVVALTEGVVQSMALFKLKAVTVALLTMCAVGFGVLAASGAGTGRDENASQKQTQKSDPHAVQAPLATKLDEPSPPPVPPATTPKKPRADLARAEMAVFLAELDLAELKGTYDKATIEWMRARLKHIDRLLDVNDLVLQANPPQKPVTDRDLWQGTWRIVSLTEEGKTTPMDPKEPWKVEVIGSAMRMPYLEGGTKWKQREYKFFDLEPAKQQPNSIEQPNTIDLSAPGVPLGRGIYEFVVSKQTCMACHQLKVANPKPLKPTTKGPAWLNTNLGVSELCDPGRNALSKSQYGLRLALSIDGKRPAKFGGDGVIVFNLERPNTQTEQHDKLTRDQKRLEQALQHETDNQKKAQIESELRVAQARLELAVAQLTLRDAQTKAEAARVQYMQAQVVVEAATVGYQLARERVDKAERSVAEAKKKIQPGTPAKEESFAVHIRTLTAAEKVISVKSTGKETVLEALVYAADDIPIKSTGVSVWVVRDKKVLPVYLPAILDGKTSTNYLLQSGDQLFIQAKAEK